MRSIHDAPPASRRHGLSALLVAGVCASWAWGQTPSTPPSPESAEPQDTGIRFTPGLARAAATAFTREVLVGRYELDEARSREVSEKIARRIMQAAHANDRQVQEILEYALPQLFEVQAAHGEDRIIPREFCVGFAKQAQPLVPAVRQLLTNIREDVQPLLPPRQQLKMAGDLLAVGAGIDTFEKTMERWSRGDVIPDEDPFDTDDRQVKKDANGESASLKDARTHAREYVERSSQSTWQRYVEQAARLYEFDEAQRATADSILREAVQRADAVKKDESWRQRALRNRLWGGLVWRLAATRLSPLPELVGDDFAAMYEPVRAVGNELKERVDKIPTQAQREAAEARVRAALAELGEDAGPP